MTDTSTSPLKKAWALLRNLLLLGIGVGLLWLTFRNQDLGEVVHKIRTANPWYILLACIASIAAIVSRSMRWIQLIEPLGYRPRLSTTYHSVMFGYLANLAIPRLGEISRCGALRKSDGVPLEKLIGTVIIERLLDVVLLLLSMAAVMVLEYGTISGFLYNSIYLPLTGKAGNGAVLLLIAGAGMVLAAVGVYILFRMPNPPRFINRIRSLLAGMIDGLISIRKVRSKGVFILHSVFIWFMYFLMSYCFCLALPETSGLDAGAALFIMVLGGLGMTAPVQGGTGAYHLLVSQGLLLYQLPEKDGVIYATLSHAVSTVLLIVLGAASLFSLLFAVKNRNSASV